MKKLLVFLMAASLCVFMYACGCDNTGGSHANSPTGSDKPSADATSPTKFEGALDKLDPSGETTNEQTDPVETTVSNIATSPEDTKPGGGTVTRPTVDPTTESTEPEETTAETTVPAQTTEETTESEEVTTPAETTEPTQETTEPTQETTEPTQETTQPEQPTIPTNPEGAIVLPQIPG